MSSFDVYSFIYASGDFQFLLGEVRITHHKYTASLSNTQTNKHSLLQSHTQTLTHAVSLSLSRSLTAHTHSLSIWLTHLVGGKNKLWERSQCVTLSVFLSICLFVYGIEWTFIMSFIVCWIVWEGCKCAFVSSILFSSACFAFRLICPFFFLPTFYMKITAVGHIDMRSIFDAHFCKLCLEKLHIFLSKIPADPFLKVYGLLLLCVDLLSRNVYADVWRYVGVNPSLLPKASDRPSRLRRRKRWRRK